MLNNMDAEDAVTARMGYSPHLGFRRPRGRGLLPGRHLTNRAKHESSNRATSAGTTSMFRNVDEGNPPGITMAMGVRVSRPGCSPFTIDRVSWDDCLPAGWSAVISPRTIKNDRDGGSRHSARVLSQTVAIVVRAEPWGLASSVRSCPPHNPDRRDIQRHRDFGVKVPGRVFTGVASGYDRRRPPNPRGETHGGKLLRRLGIRLAFRGAVTVA